MFARVSRLLVLGLCCIPGPSQLARVMAVCIPSRFRVHRLTGLQALPHRLIAHPRQPNHVCRRRRRRGRGRGGGGAAAVRPRVGAALRGCDRGHGRRRRGPARGSARYPLGPLPARPALPSLPAGFLVPLPAFRRCPRLTLRAVGPGTGRLAAARLFSGPGRSLLRGTGPERLRILGWRVPRCQ